MKMFRRSAPDRGVRTIAGQPLDLPKNASARFEADSGELSPLVRSLIDYWHASRGENGLPDRESFDASRMTRWLGYLSIYEHDEVSDDFRNRLEGSFVADLTGENWTGRFASEVDARFGSRFLAELREVRQLRLPSIDLIQIFQNEFGVAVRVMLPISSRPGPEADQVFVAIFGNGLQRRRDT